MKRKKKKAPCFIKIDRQLLEIEIRKSVYEERKTKDDKKRRREKRQVLGEDELVPLYVFFSFFFAFFFLFSFNSEFIYKKKKTHMQNGIVLVGLTAAITDL